MVWLEVVWCARGFGWLWLAVVGKWDVVVSTEARSRRTTRKQIPRKVVVMFIVVV